MDPTIDQTKQWSPESLRYVQSQIDVDGKTLFSELLNPIAQEEILSVCDLGCGNGKNLEYLVDRFKSQGVGVEPSMEAVELLKQKYADNGSLEFTAASVHSLPMESDNFDLVICWSVLHWVGRNEYLQALGELTRITKKFLVIMDFVPCIDYRTDYRHKEGFQTFKMDYDIILNNCGILSKLNEKRFWEDDQGNLRCIAPSDMQQFKGNPLNWVGRKIAIYKKDTAKLPLCSESDFMP